MVVKVPDGPRLQKLVDKPKVLVAQRALLGLPQSVDVLAVDNHFPGARFRQSAKNVQ